MADESQDATFTTKLTGQLFIQCTQLPGESCDRSIQIVLEAITGPEISQRTTFAPRVTSKLQLGPDHNSSCKYGSVGTD